MRSSAFCEIPCERANPSQPRPSMRSAERTIEGPARRCRSTSIFQMPDLPTPGGPIKSSMAASPNWPTGASTAVVLLVSVAGRRSRPTSTSSAKGESAPNARSVGTATAEVDALVVSRNSENLTGAVLCESVRCGYNLASAASYAAFSRAVPRFAVANVSTILPALLTTNVARIAQPRSSLNTP